MDTRDIWQEAMRRIVMLSIARLNQARAAIRLAEAESALVLAKAQAEARVIEAAGGEKELGSNAEARQRALTIALAADPEYQAAVKVYQIALAEARAADAQVESHREWLKVAAAALRAGVFAGEYSGDGESLNEWEYMEMRAAEGPDIEWPE